MNKSKFEELVNLYFDREISAEELDCLREELAARADRRCEFQSYYQLHQATCSALCSEDEKVTDQFVQLVQTDQQKRYVPSILFGWGVAACFLAVFATSILFLRESSDNTGSIDLEISGSFDESRYLENRNKELSSKNLVPSQPRLAGSAPDLTSSDRLLSAVDSELFQQKERYLQGIIKKINNYETYSSMPEQQFLKSSEDFYESNYWATGFKSSLASFK